MLVRWLGGKSRLAESIIGTFPSHKRYIEPFFGGGWVYFKKRPADESIINDINAELINLYRVVRDEPQELVRMVRYTPLTESMYNQVTDEYWNNRERWMKQSDVRRAFGYYYLVKTSFNSMGRSFAVNPGGQGNWFGEGILETIANVSEKLQKNTVILTRDYRSVMNDFANKDSLVYLDPPYAVTIKDAKTYYEYLMSEQEHKDLKALLVTSTFKWVLSYDVHPFVEELYKDIPNVHIQKTGKLFQSSSNRNNNTFESLGETSRFKEEYIITNFPIQESLPLFQ